LYPPPPQDPYLPTADDPFGAPPALSVPDSAPLWPSDLAADPFNPPLAAGPSNRQNVAPTSSRPDRSAASIPTGSYPPPARPGVPAPQNQPPNQPPVYRSTGTTVRSRSRTRFHWTDPLWLVPGAIWIAVSTGVDWKRQAILLALTSIAVGIAGFAIDSRAGRRLPWWAKGGIALVAGFVIGYALHLIGTAVLAMGVLLLLISVGVAWLLLRGRR
jgi:hypothetical protein